ncbi:MAG: hypothetical protein ABIO81_05355 [Ginsengibacter sp.]
MKLLLLIVLGTFSQISFAQTKQPTIRKNSISADIGFVGSWLNYEKQIKQLLTIKTSIGAEGGFSFGPSTNYFALTPTLRLEPRYYYNFNRRVKLEKKTLYNAANYFAVTFLVIPNLFTISNAAGVEFESGLHVIPKVGIKRTIGQRMNFEFGIGYGPFFGENGIDGAVGADIHIGYNF